MSTPNQRIVLNGQPFAILPIEYDKRELQSKTLLALRLIRLGFKVLIGQQWAIFTQLESLPRGVILFKGYHKIFWQAQKNARKLGHIVFAHEEEFFIHFLKDRAESYFKAQLNWIPHRILVSGELEQQALLAGGVHNTVNAGNPRSELLGTIGRNIFQDEIEKISTKYGAFVLINTNFGTINSEWGDPTLCRKWAISSGMLIDGDEKSEKYFADTVAGEKWSLNFLEGLLNALEDAKITTILRPHPGEDIDWWHKRYGHLGCVHIVREGHHAPWTMSCKILLHFGCVTGLEANIAGVQSISIKPPTANVYYDTLQVNEISEVCSELDSVVTRVILALNNPGQASVADLGGLIWLERNGRSPSQIFAEEMYASARPRFASIEIPNWDPDVPQRPKKCNITLDELRSISRKMSGCLDSITVDLREVGSQLFILAKVEARSGSEVSSDAVAEASASVRHASEWAKNIKNRSAVNFEALRTSSKTENNLRVLLVVYAEMYARLGGCPVIAAKISNCLVKIGDLVGALEWLELAMKEFPQSEELPGVAAPLYDRIGNPQKAIQLFRSVLNSPFCSLGHLASYIRTSHFHSPFECESLFLRGLGLTKDPSERIKFKLSTIEFVEISKRVLLGLDPYCVAGQEELGLFGRGRFFGLEHDVEGCSYGGGEVRCSEDAEAQRLLSYWGGSGLFPADVPMQAGSVWESLNPSWINHDVDAARILEQYEELFTRAWVSETLSSSGDDEGLIFVSCDIEYFNSCGLNLLRSLRRIGSSVSVVVHIMDCPQSEQVAVIELARSLSGRFVVAFENCQKWYVDGLEKRVFYHWFRFIRMRELGRNTSRWVWMVDADSLFRNDPGPLLQMAEGGDIAVRGRPCRLHPWNQLNAAFWGAAPSGPGAAFLDGVCGYLASAHNDGRARWGVDQLAMWLVFKSIRDGGGALSVRWLDKSVFGFGGDEQAVIWQDSGGAKRAVGERAVKLLRGSARGRYLEYGRECL